VLISSVDDMYWGERWVGRPRYRNRGPQRAVGDGPEALLFFANEVTRAGHDRDPLGTLALKAKEAAGQKTIDVPADRGYFKGEEVLQCGQLGIVPRPRTLNINAVGQFDKRDVIHVAADDEYRFPAGERAIRCFTRIEAGWTNRRYRISACPGCGTQPKSEESECGRVLGGSTKPCSSLAGVCS